MRKNNTKQARLLIQVVGPYRAKTPNGIYLNIIRAREAAELIWLRGHYAYTPHMNTALMDGLVPDERFLELGLLMIKKVDAILLIDGWEKSAGSIAEKQESERLNKTIFYDIADVPEVK